MPRREPLHVDGGADAQHGEVDAVLQVHRVEGDAVAARLQQGHHLVELLGQVMGRGQAVQQLEVGPPHDAGHHVGLAPPRRPAPVLGGGDLLDGAVGDGDLERLAHAGAVVAADEEPQRRYPPGRGSSPVTASCWS